MLFTIEDSVLVWPASAVISLSPDAKLYEYDKELLDKEEYERMDQNEINDLIADEGEQPDPTIDDPTIENNIETEADAEEMEAEAAEEHPDDEISGGS